MADSAYLYVLASLADIQQPHNLPSPCLTAFSAFDFLIVLSAEDRLLASSDLLETIIVLWLFDCVDRVVVSIDSPGTMIVL